MRKISKWKEHERYNDKHIMTQNKILYYLLKNIAVLITNLNQIQYQNWCSQLCYVNLQNVLSKTLYFGLFYNFICKTL